MDTHSDRQIPVHIRPEGVTDDEVKAAGVLSNALETVERARGALYDFHQLIGHADLMLDEVVERYMENDQSIDDIVAAGFKRSDVERVTRLIKINEYKRRQAPVGIRITHRAFGRDWRYPITSKFRA